jgi:hypothetical protein
MTHPFHPWGDGLYALGFVRTRSVASNQPVRWLPMFTLAT